MLLLVKRLLATAPALPGPGIVLTADFLEKNGRAMSSSFYPGGNLAQQREMNSVVDALYKTLFSRGIEARGGKGGGNERGGGSWGVLAKVMESFKGFMGAYADNGAIAGALPKELRGEFQGILQGSYQ